MYGRVVFTITIAFILMGLAACSQTTFDNRTVLPASLRDVPSVKLAFRFEADVPDPPKAEEPNPADDRQAAVLADFEQNRIGETLEKTVASPDKKRFVAVYRHAADLPDEYRLDMYSADGKLARKITPTGMAVFFPETIKWSPDGTNVAFVAKTRTPQAAPAADAPKPPDVGPPANAAPDANANIDANANTADANTNANTQANVPAADQPPPVLTLTTQQIYICNAVGGDLKLLTQTQGLIYFYFIWAPDSSVLAALASTKPEWVTAELQAQSRGFVFVPFGRPRIVEKNGRERRLDDAATAVQPVWSPDSAKVAFAYDKEMRIYDAIGDVPTQAGIPLKNPLLIAARAFDVELEKRRMAEEANTNANVANADANKKAKPVATPVATPTQPTDVNTLPNEADVASFNPIVKLQWPEDGTLYLQTGFVRETVNAADSVHSYMRWHRLILSPQAISIK